MSLLPLAILTAPSSWQIYLPEAYPSFLMHPPTPQQGRFPGAERLSMQHSLIFPPALRGLVSRSSLRAPFPHLPIRANSTTPTSGFQSLSNREDRVQHIQVHLEPYSAFMECN